MRSETFAAATLARLLQRRTIATMEELKEVLGSSVDMTIFRKLRELSYLTSYSHRGQYYALEDTAHFDARGLWVYRGVRFSRFGSLVDTLEAFVARAPRGALGSELAAQLGVEVTQPPPRPDAGRASRPGGPGRPVPLLLGGSRPTARAVAHAQAPGRRHRCVRSAARARR